MTSRKKCLISLAGLLVLTGCSVHTSERRDANGKSEDVDIHTPFGSISVKENSTDAKDTGLQLYPGAHPKSEEGNNKHSADVDVSMSMVGVKVVAREYRSDDSPDKILAYYRKQMDKYGNVIQCSGHFNDRGFEYHKRNQDAPVSCHGSESGNSSEQTLKVGTENNQHVVAVKPWGKGSEFALVYVRTWTDKQSM
ncbi:MAG TPA: hypothetical protein VHA33_12215 [Candidatus Angelobacter sp.]|jgi:hypothetical protein|nr:hypothetical protein [Candidatus Angelobacter sp.]